MVCRNCIVTIYFNFLQEKVAKTACMSACKHIAVSLKDFLLDNNVTQMTLPALMQFSLDLVQCEGMYVCLSPAYSKKPSLDISQGHILRSVMCTCIAPYKRA